MADFRLVSTQLHLNYITDQRAFALDPGTSGELALWGGGPNGEALQVESEDAAIVQIVSVGPASRSDNLRDVRVRAVGFGLTSLSALMPDGRAWTTADFAVGFTPGRMVPTNDVPL